MSVVINLIPKSDYNAEYHFIQTPNIIQPHHLTLIQTRAFCTFLHHHSHSRIRVLTKKYKKLALCERALPALQCGAFTKS